MIYIHIPFCIQKCRYCDFMSFESNTEMRQLYVDALCKEINAWGKQESESISSVFFGGGTPSLLSIQQFDKIFESLHSSFKIETTAEQTIEVNPGTLTEEKARFWKHNGINRISMGVQSMEDRLLKRLGRIHNRKQVLEGWEILQKHNFQNISFDLMMGLPDQMLCDWEQTLTDILQLQPKHLSCYSLIIEEGTPFFFEQDSLNLPDEENERLMYQRTIEILAEAGLLQYEISNFACPGFESRHNIGYWRRRPYIGLGLGAASLLKEQVRYHNTTDFERYVLECDNLPALREEQVKLSLQDQMEEFMFLGLRCTKGIEIAEFYRNFDVTLESVYGKVLDTHLNNGLLNSRNGWVYLTKRGLDLANSVFADFLFDA